MRTHKVATVTVVMPSEMKAGLIREAKKQDLDVSKYVRKIIRKCLNDR